MAKAPLHRHPVLSLRHYRLLRPSMLACNIVTLEEVCKDQAPAAQSLHLTDFWKQILPAALGQETNRLRARTAADPKFSRLYKLRTPPCRPLESWWQRMRIRPDPCREQRAPALFPALRS